jgi:hypothetical protein
MGLDKPLALPGETNRLPPCTRKIYRGSHDPNSCFCDFRDNNYELHKDKQIALPVYFIVLADMDYL